MDEPVRIDRWLWAARFFKSRGLAVEAVNGGRVEVNGARAKPSKDVRPGDEVQITLGQGDRLVAVVQATAVKRGPASVAALLYEETPESRAAREANAAMRRLAGPVEDIGPRPTKRDRRRFDARRGR